MMCNAESTSKRNGYQLLTGTSSGDVIVVTSIETEAAAALAHSITRGQAAAAAAALASFAHSSTLMTGSRDRICGTKSEVRSVF